jgi:hypothetical protein
MLNYSHTSPKNNGAISREDIIATSTYEELSMEFQKVFPIVSRAIELVGLMYNRLTMEDKLSHKKAIVKIYEDHKYLQGFSERNIRRSLMSLDNPNIPHRSSRKIRPSWPNSEAGEAIDDSSKQEKAKLYADSQTASQDSMSRELENTRNQDSEETSDVDCPSCNLLLVQTQKLELEKSKMIERLEQALELIREQEQKILEIQNTKSNDETQSKTSDYYPRVVDQEIALLYSPLHQAMASAFKLKENNLWLTIRFSKDAGHFTAVYIGRKSSIVHSSRSILSSHG